MIAFLVKGWLIGKINDGLRNSNVKSVKDNVGTWVNRLESIVKVLQNVLKRVSDDELSNDELDASINDIETVIRGWK